MEKKDILELNKKGRHIDEGEDNINGKAGRFASKIAQITILFLMRMNSFTRNEEAWWQLFTVAMALCFGDCLGRYRATKKKLSLFGTILCGGLFFTLLIWIIYSYANGISMVPNIWIWKTH